MTDDELDEMLQGAAGGTKKKVKKRIQSAGTPRPYGPSRHQYPKVQANYQDQFRFKVDKEQ